MVMAQIVIVEDEGIVAKDIKNRLERLGYTTLAAVSSGEKAIKIVEEVHPDLVLMDIVLKGDMNGIEAAEVIRTRFNIPVVYVTAYADEKTLQRAKVTEPYGYVLKPFDDRELHIAIEIALYKHEMEKKVRESEQWLSTTLKSIGDGVIATDMNGRITFMNPVAETLTGWTQKEAAGTPLEDILTLVDEKTGTPSEDPVKRVLQEGVTRAGSKVLMRNGVRIHIDEGAAPIKDSKGATTGVVVVFRDITERKKTERALKKTEKMYEAGQQELAEHKRMEKALRESEKKYRELVENINEVVYAVNRNGVATYVSPVIKSISGYEPSEIIGRSFSEFIHPEDVTRVTDMFSEALSGHVRACECRIATRSGEPCWVRSSTRLIFSGDSITGIHGILTDITEQKRVEEALRVSEDRYRCLFEDSPISLWEEDFSEVRKVVNTLQSSGVRDFHKYFEDHPEAVVECAHHVKVLDVNEATLKLYKAESKEDFRHGLDVFFGEESYDVFKKALIALAEEEPLFESEAATYALTGEKIFTDVRWSIAPGHEESLSRVLVSVVDITERKKAEEAIRESEEKYRTFVRNLQGIAYKGDMDWIPLFFHGAVKEITGYTEEELLAGNPRWDQIIHPDDWPVLTESAKNLRIIPNYATSCEYRIISKEGEVQWVQDFIQNICDDSGNPLYVQGIIYDITERKKAEEEIMQLSTTVGMSSDSIIITDTEGLIMDANEPALKMYCAHKMEDLAGKPFTDLVIPEDCQKVLTSIREVIRKGYCKNQEYDIIAEDGTRLTVETSMALMRTAEGTPKGIVSINRDITERKKAEREIKKKLMKYDLEGGNMYLVKEEMPGTSVEAFEDLLTVGYPGLAISRISKREFKNMLEQEVEHLWVAEKSGESFISPELKEIQGKIETLTRPTAIFMDRLDYLMSKTSFGDVLSFVQNLREVAYLKGHVVILSVDPFTLDKREYKLIEKEALPVEPLYKTKLPEELIDVLKVVYQHNLKGVNPSYTKVGQEIGVSKPTARRRIRTLVGYGYLEESKRGRTKTVELTEKGRTLFMRRG